MSEKMLVTQALDERDLLVKKIADKIAKASFVDTIKPNEDKVFAKRTSKEEYAKEAESAYQQITDLIDRFQKIDAAIVASNANMEITIYTGLLVQNSHDLVDVLAFFVSDELHDGGINITGTGSHDQAFQGSQAHGGIYAFAVLHCRYAGAVT